MTIQRLQESDAALWRKAVAELVPTQDRDHELVSEAQASDALKDDRCYLLVAIEEAEPVGLLSAFRFPAVETGGQLVYLYDIEVRASHRQKGIGTSLVNALLALCDADDVDLVWAGTERDNQAARRTFESTGGVLEGERYVEYEWDLE